MLTRIASLLKRARSDKGFTLIELVVVIGIIGALAGVAIPRYTDYKSDAENNADALNTRLVQTALELYHMAEGSWPDVTPTTPGDLEEAAELMLTLLVTEGYLRDEPVFNNGTQEYDETTGSFTDTTS